MNQKSFQTWLESSPSNAMESRIGAFAYLTLREEGRTQVTSSMLEARSALIARSAAIFKSLSESMHDCTMLLSAFASDEKSPNPVECG